MGWMKRSPKRSYEERANMEPRTPITDRLKKERKEKTKQVNQKSS